MKQAIITGASDGIGFEIAQLLAKKDYTITAVARSEDNSTRERFEMGLK